MIDIKEIAAAALPHAESILNQHLPGGKLSGREYQCGDLTGGSGDSCSINTSTGKWSDFATGEAGGDLVSLIAAIRKCSQPDAAKELAEFIGHTSTSTAPPKAAKKEIWTPVVPVPADAPAAPAEHYKHGTPAKVYIYRSRAGQLMQIIYRYELQSAIEDKKADKQFFPLTFCQNGSGRSEWRWQALPENRPLFGLELLTDTDKAILIVEGEKAAEAARRIFGNRVKILTWSGGSNAVNKTDWTSVKVLRVCIWPDADKPGYKAALAVADAVMKAGATSVQIVVPPADVCDGFDLADAEAADWTLEQVSPYLKGSVSPEEFTRRFEPEAAQEQPGPLQDYISELNAKYFVVRDGSKTFVCSLSHNQALNRQELSRMTFQDFKNYYGNQFVEITKPDGATAFKSKGAAWVESPKRRTYGEIVMMPGCADTGNNFNLWQGFAVKAVKGAWRLLRRHIFEVVCCSDDILYQYVVRWLARMFQHPEKQGEVAVVLQGGRGTGKGFFGNALCRIMGQHACHVTNSKHVTGNFNGHLEDIILLFADESFFAGDKQADNVMKGLITESSIPIERKGVDLKHVPNMLHVLMASNSDWVVPAGTDERRYCVLKVSDRYAQDHAYFSALKQEMDNGGLEAMLYELQEMDISGFNVRDVPNTAGLLDQKIQSLDPIAAWWFQKLHDGELLDSHEWEPVPFPVLYDDYVSSVQKLGGNSRRSNEIGFSKQLRKLLPSGWPKDFKSAPKDATPYAKRVKHYQFPELKICRGQFENIIGNEIEWSEYELLS